MCQYNASMLPRVAFILAEFPLWRQRTETLLISVEQSPMVFLESLMRCDENLILLQDVILDSLSGIPNLTSGFAEVVASGKALDLRNKQGTCKQEGTEMKCREGISMIWINLQRLVDLSERLTS